MIWEPEIVKAQARAYIATLPNVQALLSEQPGIEEIIVALMAGFASEAVKREMEDLIRAK